MNPRATELIALLDLEPHPEGGYFREIYRSATTVVPLDDRNQRAAITTIFFLLTGDTVNRWHRVRSDEVWHLYEGGPVEVLDLDLAGTNLHRHQLAPVSSDARPTCVIPAGHWQTARTLTAYALAGCTVGPGFDFADFELMADDPVALQSLRRRWPSEMRWV